MADADFSKGASGPGNVYDTSASGLGLSPAYLANTSSSASSAASGGGGDAGSSGPSASRPPPGEMINQIWFSTDTGIMYFSDGITWYQVPAAGAAAEMDAGEKSWVQGGLPPDSQPVIDVAVAFNITFTSAPKVVAEYHGIRGYDIHDVTTTGFISTFQMGTGPADPSTLSGLFNWIAVRA